MRPIILHPKAREVIRRFPKEVRMRLGRGLFRLQDGRAAWNAQLPANARSRRWSFGTPSEGGGRQFPRVLLYRLITGCSRFHAFVKKTQRTPPLEIELARKRLKELRHV